MKKQGFKALGILFTVVIGLTSRSKYEENPAISLQTKKTRIANTWVVAEAYNEGNDVSSDYDQFELYMSKDGDATLQAEYYFNDIKITTETDGTWKFEDSKETLALDYENNDADATYQILKLTSSEMWLLAEGDNLELRFESK